MRPILPFLILIALLLVPSPARADILQVRSVGDGAPTRITIWSDVAEPADAYLVEAGGAWRITLPLGGNAYSAEGTGSGGVESWNLHGAGIDFTLDRPMAVSRVLRLPPTGRETAHRIIVDLETVSGARFKNAARRDARRLAKIAPPAMNANESFDVRDVRPAKASARVSGASDRPVVVIDPGHGGKDPGARAIVGGVEKEITLAAALTLKSLLEADGRYKVHLTRDTDTYVALDDRVSLARDWGADLFISLHADAAGSASVAGASVYTISARGERRIDAEAGKNNWKIPIEDGTPERVSGILEDLVKRETRTRSAEFAELLLPELAAAGPVLRGTHRNAGFYVLLAPDVPAVLLELGFLTNEADAKRLSSERGRNAAVTAIKRGIDAYFDRQALLLAGG